MVDRIWVSWESQRRNRTLSPFVNAKLFELDIKLPWWRRYPLAIFRTLAICIKERPKIIFSQNPSLLLAILLVGYARLFRKKIIVDAHNAGLFPIEGKSAFLNWIAVRLTRWATLTIVSNNELVRLVTSWGGKAVAIPDPIPQLAPPAEGRELASTFNVLFICSWAEDEPYREVLNASACLDAGTSIYMTGNSRGAANTDAGGVPANIELTGFVSSDEFTRLLYACDAVMVLTTRDDCLLCGAYEGVAVGKPLILSDTAALRTYFNRGSVYVGGTADSICQGINELRRDYQQYSDAVRLLGAERSTEFQQIVADFNEALEKL